MAVPSHPSGQPGAAQNRSRCEGVRSPAQIHPSSTTETVSHGDFILNVAKRKALKWLRGEGVGNACEESTEQKGAEKEVKTAI